MNCKIVLIMLMCLTIGYSQEIVVEKVKLTGFMDSNDVSQIPRVKDVSNDGNPIVEKINTVILERFMIDTYEQATSEDFRWYGVECTSEIKEGLLYISFSGEYYGAYPNYVTDEFYFDLTSGELLQLSNIPFQALFTLSGYLDFLNTYWLSGIKDEFETAIECADVEPYCSYYDINDYRVKDNTLSISLTNDCYPHVVRACSPMFETSVPLDSIESQLNDLGKYILTESNYLSKSPIEIYIENEKLKENIPNHIFLFGKIDDQYPFSMALNIDNPEQITGYYYYDKKQKKLALEGRMTDNLVSLKEMLNNTLTGFMEFSINGVYNEAGNLVTKPYPNGDALAGKWMNPKKTKVYDIFLTEARSNHQE